MNLWQFTVVPRLVNHLAGRGRRTTPIATHFAREWLVVDLVRGVVVGRLEVRRLQLAGQGLARNIYVARVDPHELQLTLRDALQLLRGHTAMCRVAAVPRAEVATSAEALSW